MPVPAGSTDSSAMNIDVPRPAPPQYTARHGTRWEKEKAAAGKGAFEYPNDAKFVGPWVIGETVGKGASGHVKIAKHRKTGELAAVKILPLDFVFGSHMSLDTRAAKSDKQRLGIDREIIMMKLMNHPNILRIYDVYEAETELYIVLEYVAGGELFDFLVNRGKLVPLEALAYFKQIIYGLSYAHAFSIIHRDLKPENILIASLNPPLVKIADWGMATFAPPALELETSCGSPHYASPEVVNGHKYEGNATDIWSCGVILFALLTGRLPFDDKDVRTLLSKVKRGRYEIPAYVDPLARDLLTRLLVVDVSKRITIPEILAHPWFSQATPQILYVPAPSIEELARPVASVQHILRDVFDSLCVIMGQAAVPAAVKQELLSPPGEGVLAKAFYFLLCKHRETALEEHSSFMSLAPDAMPVKAITRLYMSPLSRKNRPLSLDSSTAEPPTMLQVPELERGSSAPARVEHTSPIEPFNQMTPRVRPQSPRVARMRPMSIPVTSQQSTVPFVAPSSAPASAINFGYQPMDVDEPPAGSRASRRQSRNDPRTPPRTGHSRSAQPMSAPSHRTSFMPPVAPPPEYAATAPAPMTAPRVLSHVEHARAQVAARSQASAARWATATAARGYEDDEEVFGRDNKRSRQSSYVTSEGPAGLGLDQALTSDLDSRVDRIVTRSAGQKDRKSKTPTMDSVGSPPPLSTAKSSILQSPPLGEVKGWFSNLFHWKAHAYALPSAAPPSAARDEVARLLAWFGAEVLPAADGDEANATSSTLQCSVPDTYDPRTGALLSKAVRFRVELMGPQRRGAVCTVALVHEKGAERTLRALFQRVRDEWRLSPGAQTPQTPVGEFGKFEFITREDLVELEA